MNESFTMRILVFLKPEEEFLFFELKVGPSNTNFLAGVFESNMRRQSVHVSNN